MLRTPAGGHRSLPHPRASCCRGVLRTPAGDRRSPLHCTFDHRPVGACFARPRAATGRPHTAPSTIVPVGACFARPRATTGRPTPDPLALCCRGVLCTPAGGHGPPPHRTFDHRSCRGVLCTPAGDHRSPLHPGRNFPTGCPTPDPRASCCRGVLRTPAGDHRSPLHRTFDHHPVEACFARPRAAAGRPHTGPSSFML